MSGEVEKPISDTSKEIGSKIALTNSKAPDESDSVAITNKLVVKADVESFPAQALAKNSGDNYLASKTATNPARPLTDINQPAKTTSFRTVCDKTGASSLKLQPRTSQYEKHSLLQERSASGLSEIELFLMEKNTMCTTNELAKGRQRSQSIDQSHEQKEEKLAVDRRKSMESGALSSRPRFIPRSAHAERNPLLVKTESGVSELEMFLQEKEQEWVRSASFKDEREESGKNGVDSRRSSIRDKIVGFSRSRSSSERERRKCEFAAKRAQSEKEEGKKIKYELMKSKSVDHGVLSESQAYFYMKRPSLGQLLPRTEQYEKHPLLQSRDEDGKSELDKFLAEKATNQKTSENSKDSKTNSSENESKGAEIQTSNKTDFVEQVSDKSDPLINPQMNSDSTGTANENDALLGTHEDLLGGSLLKPGRSSLSSEKSENTRKGSSKKVRFEKQVSDDDDGSSEKSGLMSGRIKNKGKCKGKKGEYSDSGKLKNQSNTNKKCCQIL